jgi:hypothetical protein
VYVLESGKCVEAEHASRGEMKEIMNGDNKSTNDGKTSVSCVHKCKQVETCRWVSELITFIAQTDYNEKTLVSTNLTKGDDHENT